MLVVTIISLVFKGVGRVQFKKGEDDDDKKEPLKNKDGEGSSENDSD